MSRPLSSAPNAAMIDSMSRKKSKWAKTWVSQTEIGHKYGLSAIKVGRVLTELGLKDKAGATQRAIDDGFAVSTPLADGTQHWRWHKARVTRAFDEHGVARVTREKEAKSRARKEARVLFNQHMELLEQGIDKLFWADVEGLREEGKAEVADRLVELYQSWDEPA